MNKLVLYCKSYRNDVLRVKRLCKSIEQYNHEKIPFLVSVPSADRGLFQEALLNLPVTLINDEEIIRANPSLIQEKIDALPGSLSQQIVKSEFWRLGISNSYLCIDSDCMFIRPFGVDDFIAPEDYPYSIIHEAKELLQFATRHGMEKVSENFHRDRQQLMQIFERRGHHYDFGPTPLLWGRQVWVALDEQFLKPRNMNFYDAIIQFPSEILWYGEAMLKYRPFPITPIEPLFKVYHYERQFNVGKQQGETIEQLSNDYLGVCYQSAWERNFDYKKKPLLSRTARWFRRKIFGQYN